MFEKDAEEYLKKDGTKAEKILNMLNEISPLKLTSKQVPFILAMIQQTFQDGAEFGYNKANEWHYPSKGEYEYPKEYEDILICFLTEDGMEDCVRGWYEYDSENDKHIFKYLNVLGTQYLKTVIAWKEIVFPKLPKEVDK